MSVIGVCLLMGIALLCVGCAKKTPAPAESSTEQSAAASASVSASDPAAEQTAAPEQATAPEQAEVPDAGEGEKSAPPKQAPSKPSKPAKPAEPEPAPAQQPAPAEEEIPKPGGTDDYTDYNASKTVASTQIVAFSCETSLLNFDLRENAVLLPPRYEFSAVREGDQVKCTCARVGEERTFTAGTAFLDQLQAIAARHDFAAQNGQSVYTHGLPEDFGTTLKVEYASGEAIRAANNQSPLLSVEAVEDLARLFFGAPEGRNYVKISQEQARELMVRIPGALVLDVRRTDEYAAGHLPGAVCVPNEDIQAGKLDALPDKDRLLLIYCRSGRRSKEAAEVLAKAGYLNVYEFGGIIDWTGEVVTEPQED